MAGECSCQGAPSDAVNTLQYDMNRCVNCGRCSQVCPHGVFAPGDFKAQLVNYEACMECGACMVNCPVNAIKVESGVGCANAMIKSALLGRKEVICGDDCCK
ncbi:MAG: ferredoxin family protein [Euryarchaeota archaeon]|nr:ferredoxin family protein [Euryarchaeota archaeon]